MEADNRKRKEVDSKAEAKKMKSPTLETTSEDHEVEEFYSILRRIHVAVSYFDKGNGYNKLTANGSRLWSQPFEVDGIEDVNGIERRKDDAKSHGLMLDLNAYPVDEPEF